MACPGQVQRRRQLEGHQGQNKNFGLHKAPAIGSVDPRTDNSAAKHLNRRTASWWAYVNGASLRAAGPRWGRSGGD